MRVLVTGGAGFIASHFIRLLTAKQDCCVISYDRFSYAGRIERLHDCLGDKLQIMWGDLASPISDWQAEKIGEVDIIVHFAAETMVDQSIKVPYPFIVSNYFGMYHLLEYARKLPTLQKLIVISTDEVYGPILEGKFKETDRLNPTNPYAATKAGADLLANSYFHSFGLPIMTLRTANNFGPWQHAEKVIPTAIRHALNGTEMTVYGDGLHRRCWLYAPDFVDGILFMLRNGKVGETYHLAGDTELSNLELIHRISDEAGHNINLKHVPDEDIRRGHDRRYGIDSTKAKELGWGPATNFFKALGDTVKWYLTNPDWLNPKGSSADR